MRKKNRRKIFFFGCLFIFLLFTSYNFVYLRGTQSALTCSKLIIDTMEHGVKYGCSVFIVNFEHISHLVLVFLLLNLSRQMPTGELQFVRIWKNWIMWKRKHSNFKTASQMFHENLTCFILSFRSHLFFFIRSPTPRRQMMGYKNCNIPA